MCSHGQFTVQDDSKVRGASRRRDDRAIMQENRGDVYSCQKAIMKVVYYKTLGVKISLTLKSYYNYFMIFLVSSDFINCLMIF